MPYIECSLTFVDDRHAEYSDDFQFSRRNTVSGAVGGDDLSLQTVRKLNEWVQKHPEYCHRSELALLGRHLYRIAFETPTEDPVPAGQHSLKTAFESTFARFTSASRTTPSMRMRIKLVFERKAETLAGLPWEFLHMPTTTDGEFLAQRTELILTRFVPDQDWGYIEPDLGSEKLRILVVGSEPRELAEVQGASTIGEIRKLESDHIDVRVFEDRATLAKLTECISGYRPHIVHFMGHGRAGRLALVKELEQLRAEELEAEVRRRDAQRLGRSLDRTVVEEAQWLDTVSVKSLFDGHKPRVVFLHACQGAASDSLEALSNTARELAYSRIPAVIAMQYEIGNNAAELFAKTFYKQLRLGTNVDEEVTAARQILGKSLLQPGRDVWDERSFGTPVIYLQTEKPIILPPPATPAESAAVSPKEPCPNPDCTAWVIRGNPFCVRCRKVLMPCPECGGMMLPELGICSRGHRLDAAKPMVAVAAAGSGSGGGFTGDANDR